MKVTREAGRAAPVWERLADGVHRVRLPVWDCTVGLVVGAGSALLVDAGSSLAEGAWLRAGAERLAGGRVTLLALTHPHFDHVFGAAAFPGAEVFAAAGAGAVLGGGAPGGVGDGVGGASGGAGGVRGGASGLLGGAGGLLGGAGGGGAGARAELRDDAVAHGLAPRAADEAAAALVRPDREVSDRLALSLGGGQEAVLADVGPGHTGHDLAVLAPASAPGERPVVFCGDLVEESGEPQAGPDAVPSRWPAALDRLLALGGEDALYVPGHGAVVDVGFVRAQRDALATRFGVSP
ncbi:MBL fold metallo-hydrolase [Streptomyces sp. NPDC046985]|uniref:MBL fold metallo-hydrolase n=1 Tax=Streptomyces sp. NPDC046985 TaxID=3155377 RepID=UPI0033C13080